MGLRTASVRRPHATVMAPALTETSQTPSFTLPPNTQSASPINSLDEDNCYISHEDHKNGIEHKQHLSNGGKDLSNVFDNLNTLALATELLKDEPLDKITGASEDSNHIMNNSPSSMGDHEDKMGLQKTGLDNVPCILKDKDVDQLFRNLSDLPVSDYGAGGDIGNNVEDLMQVIKCIEGGAERLGSNNDIGGESETIFPLSGSDLTGNLTSFEKDLFNEVDMMSMSMEEPLSEGNTLLKETQTKELIADVQKREIKLERKLEFLLRRLRKMQTRHMGQHFSSEVAGVFEHVHRTLRRLKDGASALSDVSDSSFSAFSNQPPEVLDKMKPISSSSAKNLVRKLEMSSVLQSNAASRRHSARYFGSGSSEPSAFRSNVSGVTNLPAWAPEHKQDLQRVAGFLHSEMSIVQQGLDSEATASSSGGESCDEMQNYNNPHQQYLSIQKRASWKYATERAAIAARWTWLQAQISDLEYRIRQHSDLHKQIRSNKGAVSLGGASPPHSVPSSPSAVNGYRGQLPGSSSFDSKLSDSVVNGAVSGCPDHQCARTRPLINFRKRKLLQTNGLHAVSKKAARPSTIRCGCVQPSVPCALCTGRTDPTHPRDPSDYLSKSERISMLDPCFHPVFSLPEDCSAGVHLEAIMKTPEWQQRSSRSTMKCMKYITKADRLDKVNMPVDHRPKKLDHRRKYSPLLKSSTVSALTAKIKNKFRGRKTARHPTISRFNKKRHTARVAMAQMHALNAENIDEELEALGSSGPSGKFDSPSTSPLLATQSISGFQRRNRVDSYDIDNIVIPYSVAASTRVEKLQYKEILTPKWRLAEPDFSFKFEIKNNGIVKNPANQDSDLEDMSEEAMILRHDKCEHDEKKKFLSYLKLPLGYGRSRSHKRTDSRAESSGANTPDPMSPHATDHGENMGSPLTSPPATPLSVSTDDNSNMSVTALRRRTASQSKLIRDSNKDEMRCSTPEHVDVLPYDRRVFPLSEETYEKMLKSMPEDHKFKTNIRAQDSRDLLSPINSSESKLEFHDSESTESAYGDEDPNDPEWMEIEHVKDRSKR